MESARIGASTRVRVSIPSPLSLNRRRNLLSGEWAPRILRAEARGSTALRCVRDQEVVLFLNLVASLYCLVGKF